MKNKRENEPVVTSKDGRAIFFGGVEEINESDGFMEVHQTLDPNFWK